MLTQSGATRLQRFLKGAVACLLTANAFALVLLAADDVSAPLPTEQGTRTVTLIESPDGSTMRVDPTTSAGQAAIDEAKRNGATITEATVPADEATTPTTLAQETTPTTTQSLLPLEPQDTVDDAQDVVNDTIDKVQETAPTPLDDTVDDVQDTLDDTVDTIQETVTTVLGPITTTTTKPATTTTTKPVTSVVEDTVEDTVGGLTGGLGL